MTVVHKFSYLSPIGELFGLKARRLEFCSGSQPNNEKLSKLTYIKIMVPGYCISFSNLCVLLACVLL